MALWLAMLESGVHATIAGVIMCLMPSLFALANAGVALSGDLLATAATSAVTLGIVLGLALGKTLGITLATWIAVKLGAGRLPTGTNWPLLVAIAAVAGIGFTVALFITELAFRGEDTEMLTAEAKIGVLVGSLIAVLLGAGLVAFTAPKRRPAHDDADEDSRAASIA
ncbi:Na+/H+ antiporter NhaA [Glycomyces rhizosphaerae]|uniref:Na+/H+ antiporter NhaA n=1 Tax=Glycomyces rhizosphaerae TaxID=2054422 RepID=A0ABV7PSG0_9ACTN